MYPFYAIRTSKRDTGEDAVRSLMPGSAERPRKTNAMVNTATAAASRAEEPLYTYIYCKTAQTSHPTPVHSCSSLTRI